MTNCEDVMSQNNHIEYSEENEMSEQISELIKSDDVKESSLLNSIVEAVMRGDMNQVVSLALSHRNIESKDKNVSDESTYTALQTKISSDQNKEVDLDLNTENERINEVDVPAIEILEFTNLKSDSNVDILNSNSIYSTPVTSGENNDMQCSYYIDSNSVINSSNNIKFCQSGFHNGNVELDNNSEGQLNGQYQTYQTSASIHNDDCLNSSQQSVQVQLPGIGNFLIQIPSNLKPGEPITLPINLPLTPVSTSSVGNPISINLNTGQIISNQLLSLYNPSSCMNNIGRKMRAIAPKPSKPLTYRQPLIAPKTSSPMISDFNRDCGSNVISTAISVSTGPGRRKGSKGKKVGRKRGPQSKSRKNSNYASSTYSMDSQDESLFNEPISTVKQNCNNFISTRNTYPCNYFVNRETSDYISSSKVVPQSYNESHSDNLIGGSDSGEKDLLSLAWEISNAELGNNDDYSGTYNLYDTNNLSTDGFVSTEILDQFLQNIQKDDISECSSNQINLDQRISYSSPYTTLPPCSTVLPSVAASHYLKNSSNEQTNLELTQCIEIAEVVNLNTEDMLSELEKEENALFDKFVSEYSSESLKCDTHTYGALNSSSVIEIDKLLDDNASNQSKIDDSEKDMDQNAKESIELSEIAKQIENECNEFHLGTTSTTKAYLSNCSYNYQNSVDLIDKANYDIIINDQDQSSLPNSGTTTTPLELMYSVSTESLCSTIVDCQNQYIGPVNIDNQEQSEITYLFGDETLQSKTLDDFGLFDICTETSKSQNGDVIIQDEKKLIAQPILEDISDASPIPSDQESEDEEINMDAFKLSIFNHVSVYSSNIYRSTLTNTENLWYNSARKSLPNLNDKLPLERPCYLSDKWYIYDAVVNMSDAFSCPAVDEENKKSVICNKDETTTAGIDLQSPIIHLEASKSRRIKRSNQKPYYNKESRLRKSSTKLALYHSTKPNNCENSIYNTKERRRFDIYKVEKDKPRLYNRLKFKRNISTNHCTRSKGTISKTYESFYETLEKTNRSQHPKIPKQRSRVLQKKKSEFNAERNVIISDEIEIINLSEDENGIDKNLNRNIFDHLESSFLSTNDTCKSPIQGNDGVSIREDCDIKSDKLEVLVKVAEKYNLRRNISQCRPDWKKKLSDKTSEDVKCLSKNSIINPQSKISKENGRIDRRTKLKESDGPLKENKELLHAGVFENESCFDILLSCDDVEIDQYLMPINIHSCELHNAIVSIINSTTYKDYEILKINNQDNSPKIDSELNVFKKHFPVRKINRKLRLRSGLEWDKNVNHATITDVDNFEHLTVYALDIQIVDFSVFLFSLISSSECLCLTTEQLIIQYECQCFDTNDDENLDKINSYEARLVTVESEKPLNQISVHSCELLNIIHNQSLEVFKNEKKHEILKKYSLRNISQVLENESISSLQKNAKRLSLKRSCKRNDNSNVEIIPETISIDEENIIDIMTMKTPICSIEKLSDEYLLANINVKNLDTEHVCGSMDLRKDESCITRKKFNALLKGSKRHIKKKPVVKILKSHVLLKKRKNLMKQKIIISDLKDRLRSKIQLKELIAKKRLTSIEINSTKISNDNTNSFEVQETKKNESFDEVVSVNNLSLYDNSKNIETFSRSYGSIVLKIKFQRPDSDQKPEIEEPAKKRRKHSRKRKRLHNFLNSIIERNSLVCNNSTSSDEETDYPVRHNKRKRKHSIIDSILHENNDSNQNIQPYVSTEIGTSVDEEVQQKPIKIKLFKSTNDEYFKSEEMIFSLQKNDSVNKRPNTNSFVPKMLQVMRDQPPKPCRQAANLAKTKIFSTAKKDRRSQSSTLCPFPKTSKWTSGKLNNVLNKPVTENAKASNNHRRKPRGRPPKSLPTPLSSEKLTSSSGTLKLKIRLSKDFNNYNDDNHSSNGDLSGRTSTNDSSILNSAVAGINGPSDVISLESNNFIDRITEELGDNIDYLEAKEAKVYFDPHQVDIEKIKNSYYSSRRSNSVHFDCESQQNFYDESITDLCNKKKDKLCNNNQDFSNYIQNESSTSYNKNLAKNFHKNCYNSLSVNCEFQDLSQSNQPNYFDNQILPPGQNQMDVWKSSKSNPSELHSPSKNSNLWCTENRIFPNSNHPLYDCYRTSKNTEDKNGTSHSQNSPFIICENESPDSKHIQMSTSKRGHSNDDRESSNNSFESHGQLSPNFSRGALGSVSSQLTVNRWSDEINRNASLNHTAAAWMTYAQQQAASAAYMDPQMKAYYNLALSQSMLNNSYGASYSNSPGNPQNVYSSIHSQYLNNSKNINEKASHTSGAIRNNSDPMGTFMEAAQMSSWEHFYSAAAMAGYHNSSQGSMDDYNGFF